MFFTSSLFTFTARFRAKMFLDAQYVCSPMVDELKPLAEKVSDGPFSLG